MGTHGPSSKGDKERPSSSSKSRRRSRRSDDSEFDDYSDSDRSESGDKSPVRSKRRDRDSRSKSSRRSGRRGRDSDESSGSSDDSDDRGRKKKRSSREITEEEIAEYMSKKAQKKVLDSERESRVFRSISFWRFWDSDSFSFPFHFVGTASCEEVEGSDGFWLFKWFESLRWF